MAGLKIVTAAGEIIFPDSDAVSGGAGAPFGAGLPMLRNALLILIVVMVALGCAGTAATSTQSAARICAAIGSRPAMSASPA